MMEGDVEGKEERKEEKKGKEVTVSDGGEGEERGDGEGGQKDGE